jgi:PPK2 family polyphosphate:nucleotide phosphotransferase
VRSEDALDYPARRGVTIVAGCARGGRARFDQPNSEGEERVDMRAARDISIPYRIDDGSKFRLKDFDPGDTNRLKSKEHAEEELQRGVQLLSELQDKLYAQNRWAVLVIFQAMDAAGKDSAIKHVMSGVNPQGCEVFSFKQPSVEELSHDFLWRTSKCVPERGRIGIFNRSYYEEVLVTRVHKEMLERERIPPSLMTKDLWKERFDDINAHERYLARNGVVIRKFFLNLSKREQRKRFLRRLEEPAKNWKFSEADISERGLWRDYMSAYEQMIQHTATPHAPWYVVPADNKWYTRLVVAAAIVHALEELNLSYPKVDAAKRKELKAARIALEHEGNH